MEKINFEFNLSHDQLKQRQDLTIQLLKNKTIQTFLKKYDLSDQFVEDHSFYLQDYLIHLQKCDGCEGLSFCIQETKGYYFELLYHDFIVDKALKPCHYLKEKHNQLQHKKNFIYCDLSDKQLQYSFETTDPSSTTNYLNIYLEASNFNTESQVGCYYYGDPGVGKTYLASCIANHFAKKEIKVAFVHVPSFVSRLKNLMSDHQRFRKTLDNLANVPVLFLDDIGGESASAWSRDDILLPLLNDRMENQKLTFFTSNRSLNELQDFYEFKGKGNYDPVGAMRILERIKTLSHSYAMKGESRRR